MRYGADYYRLKKVRDVLSRIICDEKTPARDVPRCITALISLERFIREQRGIPPLAPVSFRDLQFRPTRKLTPQIQEPVET